VDTPLRTDTKGMTVPGRLVLLALTVVSVMAALPSREDVSVCVAPDEFTSDLIDGYRWADTTSDTATISWRQRVSLPTVAYTQIVLVSDTTVCRRAVNKYNAVLADSGDTRTSASAAVVKWGPTRYAVSDSARTVGEWIFEVIVDSSFTQVFGFTRQ
jgi:hypothetical protein